MTRQTPVRIRGVVYPSVRAAAEAMGVTTRTIYSHLDNGTIDNAGIGSGHGPKPRRRKGHRHGRVPLSTHIRPEDRDLMKQISIERKISMAEIQEMAIREWLARNETPISDDEDDVGVPVKVFDAVATDVANGEQRATAGQRLMAAARQVIEAVRRGDIP